MNFTAHAFHRQQAASAAAEAGHRSPRCCTQLAAVSCFLLAAAPLLAWYFQRITDQSDEPLGVLALFTAMVLLAVQALSEREAITVAVRPAWMLCGTGVLLALQSSPFGQFPLLSGIVAVATVGSAVRMPPGKPGFIALLVLSLPLVASLDFYAGYPLRLMAADLSTRLLRLCGVEVIRSGVLLQDGDTLVGMDPPCAGVRMLWTACFTAAVVAMRARLTTGRTLLLLSSAVGCVVLGNGLRAAIVFFPESGRVHWPEWMHPAAGLLVHGGVLSAVFKLGQWIEPVRRKVHGMECGLHSANPAAQRTPVRTPCMIISVAGLVLLSVGTWLCCAPAAVEPTPAPWPATLQGVPLAAVPLGPHEARFAQAFPGHIAKFQCSDAEVIMRSVARPTRRMHPASHCLQASGFTVTSKPLFRDTDQRVWGCCLAERGGQTWRVRERYTNAAQTRICTDASAWFWEALLHPGEGPWLAVTVMERVEPVTHGSPRA